MTAPDETNAIAMLTAALGGRRIYTLLWLLWMSACCGGSIALDVLPNQKSSSARAIIAIAISVIVFAFVTFDLVRSLSVTERRGELLARSDNTLRVSVFLRVAVWCVPLVGLAAISASFIIK